MSDSGTPPLEMIICGDDLIRIDGVAKDKLRLLGTWLRNQNTFDEVVDGLESLTVQFDPIRHEREHVLWAIVKAFDDCLSEECSEADEVVLDVLFGGQVGPDMEMVCDAAGCSSEDLIEMICRSDLRVEMLGFTPGFAYISGLPESITVARLATPRKRVEAGSFGVAAGMCGTYALAGPGGWPIIGQVQTVLFDAKAQVPFTLSAGKLVRFREVKPR